MFNTLHTLYFQGVVVWSCVMDSHHVAVIDGPAWRIAVVWGLRALVLLPVPITAIYVVKSQLAYGVKDVRMCVNACYSNINAVHDFFMTSYQV